MGVVRIVKTPQSESSTSQPECESAPLFNRTSTASEDPDRVTIDVRVADLFRQYKQKSEKSVILSVLDNLSTMGIDGKILVKFPGFVQLVEDLAAKASRSELSSEETLKATAMLANLGVRESSKFKDIGASFSNQVVGIIGALSKRDLVKLLARLVGDMRMTLDAYATWCLNKEFNRWATDASISDEEFIRDVLGPLQVIAQDQLVDYFRPVLSNPSIESRIISLINERKLKSVQIVELIMKLRNSEFTAMAQAGIASVLSSHKEKLLNNLKDVSVLISALPKDPATRDASVQSELVEILLHHFKSEQESVSADRIRSLLTCASGLLSDVNSPHELEILGLVAPLVRDNALIVSKIKANTLADLFHTAAVAAVSSHSEAAREPFMTICSQIESVIVGNLPSLGPAELAKMSLAFASGVRTHVNSFRALAATIRQKAPTFGPSDFVDAAYALAYKGLISKAILVEGRVEDVVRAVPVAALPRLAWAVAVSGLSMSSVWDTLMKRIEREILIKPDALGKLTNTDESMLYEVLVACRLNQYWNLSGNAVRRMGQFQQSWKQPVAKSEIDYEKLLEGANIKVVKDFKRLKTLDLALLDVPLYLPEYRLVIDASKTPLVEAGGLTHGSVKLRHALWARMRLNVIGIADSQFSGCATDADRAAMLGSVIGEFASEIQLERKEVRDPQNDWISRRRTGPSEETTADADGQWSSRDESGKNRPRERVAGWTSRQ